MSDPFAILPDGLRAKLRPARHPSWVEPIIVIGYYDGRKLRYAGKVGTGYNAATLRELARRLKKMQQRESPFAVDGGLPRSGVHWVRPELVAQIGFTEVTAEGKLRHPRYLGLRHDKPAREVVLRPRR